MDDATRIGAHVRTARLRRGLSLSVAAGLTGHSKSWLSKVERGVFPLERRSDIAALANALGVSAADLIGQPYELDTGGASGARAASVAAIRMAVFDEPAAARPVPELVLGVESLTRTRQSYRIDESAAMAAALIGQLRGAARARTGSQALPVLFWGLYETLSTVKDLGYGDLALALCDQLERVADDIGRTELPAVAAFQRAYTLAAVGMGAYAGAARVATQAADALAPVDAEALAALGQLHLAAGFAYAAAGRPGDAWARLDEAGAVAGRVDGPTTVAGHCAFGLPNVGLHRVAVGVELADPDRAVAAAGQVNAEAIPYPARRASYWADLGRAHAQLGHDDAAVKALRCAEEIAPLRVRLHPLVREAVAGMVDRAHRAAVGRELRGLAYRMGLPN